MALTEQQQTFVREYLVDMNATQAYIRAGYKARGSVAEAAASRLLRNVKVAAAVAEAQQARAERTEVTQDMVIAGLLREATYTDYGSSHSARVSAWAHLGKHLGMFKEQVDHGGRVTVEVVYVDLDGED